MSTTSSTYTNAVSSCVVARSSPYGPTRWPWVMHTPGVDGGELWLFSMHIAPYDQAVGFGAHDPDRKRKLLVHRSQIDELMGLTQQQSLTLVPLSIYFKEGRAKVELALAKGRKMWDKRHAIADRDAGRDAARDAAYA